MCDVHILACYTMQQIFALMYRSNILSPSSGWQNLVCMGAEVNWGRECCLLYNHHSASQRHYFFFFYHKSSSVWNRPYRVKSKWHVLVSMGVYVQEPLVGGKQTACLLNHCFIVACRVYVEQKALHKLLVENVNNLPSRLQTPLTSPNCLFCATSYRTAIRMSYL